MCAYKKCPRSCPSGMVHVVGGIARFRKASRCSLTHYHLRAGRPGKTTTPGQARATNRFSDLWGLCGKAAAGRRMNLMVCSCAALLRGYGGPDLRRPPGTVHSWECLSQRHSSAEAPRSWLLTEQMLLVEVKEESNTHYGIWKGCRHPICYRVR